MKKLYIHKNVIYGQLELYFIKSCIIFILMKVIKHQIEELILLKYMEDMTLL